MRKNIGLLVIIVLLTIPLLLWLTMEPLSQRMVSFTLIVKSIGQLAGIFGLVLFSINLILSARLKIFEDYFAGLNNLYLKHHLIGAWALILLLIHPIFLTLVNFSSSIYVAASFLLPNLNRIDVILGETALGIMIVALFLTFFSKLAYDVWKFTHKFLGIAFIIAFLHLTKVTSDVSVNPLLNFYLLSLAILAITAYLYRAVFGKILVRRLNYFVKKVTKLNDDCYEIVLHPEKIKLIYYPGQYIFIEAVGAKVSSEEHPFSITSSPKNEDLKLLIKNLGDYTSQIGLLKEGNKVEIEGPFGRFSPYFTGGRDFIFIAGGIGITPFLSIIEEAQERVGIKLDVYYSVGEESEMVYKSELKKNNLIRFFPHFTSREGHLNVDLIAKTSGNLVGKKIFICGPLGMIQSLKQELMQKGVSKKDIYSEEFQF